VSIQYNRILKIALPLKQSAFLWGARKTGKSTYLTKNFKHSIRYDLLQSELFLKYAKQPYLLRQEILALSPEKELKYPIILDEVQRIPLLLNEVHWLIENTTASFILCGSSARALKRKTSNLLGGRAWKYHFYPLVYPEINDFDLLKVLNTGLIPSHYLSSDISRSLEAYVQDYLKEEIMAEGLVRHLPAFARFLDTVAFSNGELVNFSNIARDCSVDSKTVKSYYEILVDTLLGYFIYPYSPRNPSRNLIFSMPKFYLFDVGVAGFLTKRSLNILKGNEAGRAFEHFIFMELMAYQGIRNKKWDIRFWRTKQGLEVDFVLGDAEVAIEVKISSLVQKSEITGLIAFNEEYAPHKAIVVSLDSAKRKLTHGDNKEILILPYQEFLKQLWNDELI
jgi:uncharacterized protein